MFSGIKKNEVVRASSLKTIIQYVFFFHVLFVLVLLQYTGTRFIRDSIKGDTKYTGTGFTRNSSEGQTISDKLIAVRSSIPQLDGVPILLVIYY